MQVSHLDHLVLTVANLDKTIDFYTRVLGMSVVTFGQNRKALVYGSQKINLHELGKEFEPKARQVQAGSADLCFIAAIPLPQVIEHLQVQQVEILEGPVERTGAVGKILSVYIRDPDGNLLEIAN
jgi:catechol 2,3-dioxygenase-like lactoylglutathione lyase family enzyme